MGLNMLMDLLQRGKVLSMIALMAQLIELKNEKNIVW